MKPAQRALPRELTLELGLDAAQDPEALRARVARELGVDLTNLPAVVLRKRSLDCRKGRIRYHLLFEIAADGAAGFGFGVEAAERLGWPHPVEVQRPAKVLIVGAGPCGLFCAYELARFGIGSIVLDRGKPVQPRRRDLKGLTRHGRVDADSNYCFGEGGAGTYSDGKLYTRSHKRGPVRDVLEILALHGAPAEILVDARPHIGSNKLPEVVTALRERLEGVGVEFRFGARVTRIAREPGAGPVCGIELADGSSLAARAVVLCTGHSAGDVYQLLQAAGHPLEPKPFALGVRIEHPQPLIDGIQYGAMSGHPALPSAAYKLVDSRAQPPVFSFCMCPGGFIVPATTEPGHLVVNGMSPSRRNSRYANSGLVVGVDPSDCARAGYTGPLAGLELQRTVERAAFEAGGALLQAPATRVTDFLEGRASSTAPKSSYVPGLTPSDVAAVLDRSGLDLSKRLRQALLQFGRNMKGYITEEAVLVAVESRTSAPVRIPRNPDTLESPAWPGLYPGGEGGGHAGGIVSAALDGVRIAREESPALPELSPRRQRPDRAEH